jgi:hypothetical protein
MLSNLQVKFAYPWQNFTFRVNWKGKELLEGRAGIDQGHHSSANNPGSE